MYQTLRNKEMIELLQSIFPTDVVHRSPGNVREYLIRTKEYIFTREDLRALHEHKFMIRSIINLGKELFMYVEDMR